MLFPLWTGGTSELLSPCCLWRRREHHWILEVPCIITFILSISLKVSKYLLSFPQNFAHFSEFLIYFIIMCCKIVSQVCNNCLASLLHLWNEMLTSIIEQHAFYKWKKCCGWKKGKMVNIWPIRGTFRHFQKIWTLVEAWISRNKLFRVTCVLYSNNRSYGECITSLPCWELKGPQFLLLFFFNEKNVLYGCVYWHNFIQTNADVSFVSQANALKWYNFLAFGHGHGVRFWFLFCSRSVVRVTFLAVA